MMYDQKRDLPEGVNRSDVEQELDKLVVTVLREMGHEPPEGLHVVVYDDRERTLRTGQANLGSHAAEIARSLVMAAHDMMRVAGNARHNSPNGFDGVMGEAIRNCREAMHKANDSLLRAERVLDEWVKRGGWDEVMMRQRIERERRARERAGGS